ncbi:DNA topoisomerase, partial [Microvirga aerophila]|uniref:DNA topoisomerase n=1 Tax=Microvirga aerophila TaxID=670291 RepID=UPI0011BD544A
LFSKDTLARRCAKRFGWDPQHTAKLAQELYDQGYLTYPRTESEYLPDSQTSDAAAVIGSVVGVLTDLASLVPATGSLVFRRGNKGHYVKDPGEHHAIVPLRKVPQPRSINGDQLRLWELVAKSFLAAHLPDGIDARTTIAVQVATALGPKRFSVSGSVIKSPGWRSVYGAEADEETEAVPGKAKADEEPTAGRLPPVRDNELGKATDARIETAKTEPPRRITRGELPVVMGRLIDQVEDPALKAALENPANPTEPKGLGTAATRDTILPKLQKSQYVDLLKGKDPPIQVTEVGLAFIAAVRRVFPSYGDPVGRAMFEADLAEIGRAATRDEAVCRAAAYQERTRTRVQELIGAISQSQTVAVDPASVPASSAAAGKPPTKAMIAFATSIATRNGLKLPRGLKSNGAICRAFLDQHAPARSSEPGEHRLQNGPRPPSEAMMRYARALAEEHGIECPPAVTTDFAACRSFLDEYASGKASRAEVKKERAIRKGRSPVAASRDHRDNGAKAPTAKKPTSVKARSTQGRARARPATATQPSR